MSSWSRSSYRPAAAAATENLPTDGWTTVGAPRATRTWGGGSESSSSRWASSGGGGGSNRTWGGGAPRSEMPSAFSKKPREDDRPRRMTDEEVRRDYMMKQAAEKARLEAEQAKQIADTEDNFPSLGAKSAPPFGNPPKRSTAPAAPLPKKSWAAQIKIANDEHEQKRQADEQAAKEAADKLAEGMTVLRLGRKDMREPFFTTGQIETEADFFRNEAIRRACFSSTIMEEQEKYDYNRELNYREDDLDDEPPRAYSPHSPTYPHSFDDEDDAHEE